MEFTTLFPEGVESVFDIAWWDPTVQLTSSAAMLYLYSAQTLPYPAYCLIFCQSPTQVCFLFVCLFVPLTLLAEGAVSWFGSFGLFLGVLDMNPLSLFLSVILCNGILRVLCLVCVFLFYCKKKTKQTVKYFPVKCRGKCGEVDV